MQSPGYSPSRGGVPAGHAKDHPGPVVIQILFLMCFGK